MKALRILTTLGVLGALSISAPADMGLGRWSQLKARGAQATSSLREQGFKDDSYAPWRAVDHNPDTVWCAAGDGIGARLVVLVTPESARNVVIFGGVANGRRLYYENNRIREVEIAVTSTKGEKLRIRGELPDDLCYPAIKQEWPRECPWLRSGDNSEQAIAKCKMIMEPLGGHSCSASGFGHSALEFGRWIQVAQIEIIIRSVYPGTKYNNTCIAEVGLNGYNVNSQGDVPGIRPHRGAQ